MAAVPLAEATSCARGSSGPGSTGVDIAAVNGPELTVRLRPARRAGAGCGRCSRPSAVPCRPLATTHAFHSRMLAPVKARADRLGRGEHHRLGAGDPVRLQRHRDDRHRGAGDRSGVLGASTCARRCGSTAASATVIAPRVTSRCWSSARGSRSARWRAGTRTARRTAGASIVPTLPAAADPRPASDRTGRGRGPVVAGRRTDRLDGLPAGRPVAKVGLPGYAFQRERYWIDAPAGGRPAARQVAAEQQQFAAVSQRASTSRCWSAAGRPTAPSGRRRAGGPVRAASERCATLLATATAPTRCGPVRCRGRHSPVDEPRTTPTLAERLQARRRPSRRPAGAEPRRHRHRRPGRWCCRSPAGRRPAAPTRDRRRGSCVVTRGAQAVARRRDAGTGHAAVGRAAGGRQPGVPRTSQAGTVDLDPAGRHRRGRQRRWSPSSATTAPDAARRLPGRLRAGARTFAPAARRRHRCLGPPAAPT